MIEIVPLERVGVFKFGTNIDEYDINDLKKQMDDKRLDEIKYYHKNGLIIYVEEDLIVSIVCNKACHFNSKKIIGERINHFIQKNNISPNLNLTDTIFLEGDESKPHIIYEFEELGMQIWTKNSIIVTVFCSDE